MGREIEITEEMVVAGVRALRASGKIDWETSSDFITVREILEASLEAHTAPDRAHTDPCQGSES